MAGTEATKKPIRDWMGFSVVTVGLEPTVSLRFACSVRFAIVVIPPWNGGITPLLTTLPPRFIRHWRRSAPRPMM